MTLKLFRGTIHERYALAERIELGIVLVPRVHEDGSPEVGVVRTHLGQEEIDLVNVRVHDDAEDVLKATAAERTGPCGGAIRKVPICKWALCKWHLQSALDCYFID